MVSVNKVLTKINFEEIFDYSGFAKEPQKVMQRGMMHVGETGVKVVENFVLCINNKEALDKHLMSLAYSKGKHVSEQVVMGNQLLNGIASIKKVIKSDVSALYAKRDLIEMVDGNLNSQRYFVKRAQEELSSAHKSLSDYSNFKDPKHNDLVKNYHEKLDAYHETLAYTSVLRDTLNEIVDAHKNRPLNKFAKLFGI